MKKTSFQKSLFFTLLFAIYFLNSFAQSGSLDSSFGKNGQVISSENLGASVGHCIQKDGKIVQATDFNDEINLVRYNKDGSVDESFGEGGVAHASYGNLGFFALTISGINIQSDDKVIVVGWFNSGPDFATVYAATMRFNPDGSIDESYGNNGVVTRGFTSHQVSQISIHTFASVESDKQGRIITGGNFQVSGGDTTFVLRYLADGTPDDNFGTDGKMQFPFFVTADFLSFGGNCLLHLSNDKILVGGGAGNFEINGSFAVTRLLSNGIIDSSFGINGFALTQVQNNKYVTVNFLNLQSKGNIVATGYCQKGDFTKTDIALARFTSDGNIDESFGTQGTVVTHVANGYYENAKAIAVQANNKIVMGYFLSKTQGAADYFELYRYTENGLADSSFGNYGRVTTDFTGLTGYGGFITGLSINNDGKILATGNAGYELALARYLGDPTHPIVSRIKRWIKNHTLHFENPNENENTAYYIVEQSNNESSGFMPISNNIIANKNEYSYALPATKSTSLRGGTTKQSPTTLFRIKAVNKDNSFTYSNAIADNDQLTNQPINQLTISPNPANDYVTINGLNPVMNYELRIMNKEGRQVYSINPFTGRGINISSLQSGLYFIKINDGIEETSLKFIKD